MVPSKEPMVVPATMSNRRSTVKLPVAPSNRPVPPVIVAFSTMETTPGVSVDMAWPVNSAGSGSPGGCRAGECPSSLLGTHRPLSSINHYQSVPSTSPPAGVTAAHQVVPLRLGASVRTLPSAIPTWMPPVWAVAARVGSQLPSNGVGWTWNFDPGPMALGAPRAARAGMQNPGWNALPGNTMGGGCQASKTDVEYAQAVPPSRNGGGRAGSVVEQRAYFSAWRM